MITVALNSVICDPSQLSDIKLLKTETHKFLKYQQIIVIL